MRRIHGVICIFVAALLVTGAAAAFAGGKAEGGGAKGSLSFWAMPFVTQEVSPDYVKQWMANVKTVLPDYNVDNFFGPGDYGPQRDKYLVQAQSGSPDVIEGVATRGGRPA
ncbi:MAG: hypothetical protein ACLQCB_03075, partial [Spirochaetia bacterium]